MGFAARFTKRTAVIGTVSAVALAGGVAFAAWTINGGGRADAKAGQAQEVSFGVATTGQPLYPNNIAVEVHAAGSNKNPFNVAYTVSGGTLTVDTKTCGVGSVTFKPSEKPVNLDAGDGKTAKVTDVVVGTLTMATSADDGCQGATFSVAITGKGESA